MSFFVQKVVFLRNIMTIEQQLTAWSELGKILKAHADKEKWHSGISFISEEQYLSFETRIEKTFYKNGWFEDAEVRNSLDEISSWLQKDTLEKWLSNYSPINNKEKAVAIIMAGNIPMVGFHDLLCVLLSGFHAKVKLSSEDDILIPALIDYITFIAPFYRDRITFSDRKIGEYDAIIATGDHQSNQAFQTYFSSKPHLFRGHRTSIAIVTGSETKEELKLLGNDIFQYFGRGCRNITHLCVPVEYNFDIFFQEIISFSNVIQNKKYGNNYDYNKAIHLMNLEVILDNNFLLLKKTQDLHAPIGMLYYHEYKNTEEVQEYIKHNEHEIQCIIGHGFNPFGLAQKPKVDDYADNIDTMKWLASLPF